MACVTVGAPSLLELAAEYNTDAKCVELLETLRWPNGPCCPKCAGTKAWDIEGRKVYQCGDCDFQYSVTTGTVMHSTKLPLVKWILAAALISNARKGVSSCQLARDLRVQQKTAWYLGMRLRRAMRETEWLKKFTGICEVDETYLGGKRRGPRFRPFAPKMGPFYKKTAVFGARERGGKVRMEIIPDATNKTLKRVVDKYIEREGSHIMSDNWAGYRQIAAEFTMSRIDHTYEYVRGEIHTNSIESIWAIVRRQFHGTHHKMSPNYLPLYLGEICYRFNHRERSDLFRMVLGNGMVTDRLVLNRRPENGEEKPAP